MEKRKGTAMTTAATTTTPYRTVRCRTESFILQHQRVVLHERIVQRRFRSTARCKVAPGKSPSRVRENEKERVASIYRESANHRGPERSNMHMLTKDAHPK